MKYLFIAVLLTMVVAACYYDFYYEPPIMSVPTGEDSVVGVKIDAVVAKYGKPTRIGIDGEYNVHEFDNGNTLVIFYSQGGIVKGSMRAEMIDG